MAAINSWVYSRVFKYIIEVNLVFSIITYAFNPSQFVQSIFVYLMLAFSIYNYFSYVTKVSRQMASILGIRIFHLDA